MDQKQRTRLVIDLLAGHTTTSEAAAALGVSEDEVLAQKALYLDGAAYAINRSEERTRLPPRFFRVMAPLAAMAAFVGFVGVARSQPGACEQTLPAPLTTFCPQSPARASDMNGNFQQIVNWVQSKIGPVTASGVVTTTTLNAATSTVTTANAATSNATTANSTTANTTNLNATRITNSGYTPRYAPWSSQGEGDGGAAIYNDGSGFRTLMIVGNNSGGGTRRVGLWDEVTVNGNLIVNGATTLEGRTMRKYVVNAGAGNVGRVVGLDVGTMHSLCRDDDGCSVSVAMVNFDNQGTVASRTSRLYISQSSSQWRLDNDIQGPDSDGGVTEWGVWDCYLTDAETSTDGNNGRRDNGWGHGLLNATGGNHDGWTGCRVVFED